MKIESTGYAECDPYRRYDNKVHSPSCLRNQPWWGVVPPPCNCGAETVWHSPDFNIITTNAPDIKPDSDTLLFVDIDKKEGSLNVIKNKVYYFYFNEKKKLCIMCLGDLD